MDDLASKREESSAFDIMQDANPPQVETDKTELCLLNSGLDALASLASEEHTNSCAQTFPGIVASAPTSSDEESEQMLPPPPRRRRSASNPEGMEKWDSLNRTRSGGGTRRHFVLPESILEEELAEANAAVRERELVKSEQMEREAKMQRKETKENGEEVKTKEPKIEEEDESMLTPEELLRKARSRLLEDLSEGSINGEKGQLMLPHALGKYKHVSWADEERGLRLTYFVAQQNILSTSRFTTKMAALGYTHPQNALQSLLASMRSVNVVCGTRKFATIVSRAWPIAACV